MALQQLATAQAVVQVLLAEADTDRHLEGSFAVATVDGAEVGYVDTPARGCMLDSPEVMEARPVTWRKSSYSGGNGGGCVEVAALPGGRYVRDSKNPDGGRLGFAAGGLPGAAGRHQGREVHHWVVCADVRSGPIAEQSNFA